MAKYKITRNGELIAVVYSKAVMQWFNEIMNVIGLGFEVTEE